MVDTVRERILQTIETKLLELVSTTLRKVSREDQGLVQLDENPSCFIVDRGEEQKRHAQFCYECDLSVELKIQLLHHELAKKNLQIQNVLGAVQAKVMANQTWGALARRTDLGPSEVGHAADAADPYTEVRQMLSIKYYFKEDDPTVVAVV